MAKLLRKGARRFLRLIVLLGATVPASATSAAVAGSWDGFDSGRPHPAVVRVVVSEGEGGMSLGSGSLIAVQGRHGLVVTNWHVVRDAHGPINVIFPDGFRSGASVLATDADWDLAALAIWRPNVEPLVLSQRAPQLGEELSIAGYGSGRYRLSSGRCVQYISPGSNHPFEMLELSASARDGDSGGPILNAEGKLAGVLFGAARGRTAGSYCGRVQWFLNSVSARFNELPMPTDTMVARDTPAPAVEADPAAASIREVAMSRPREPVDPSWEPSIEEPPAPSRGRAMPLVSIPAPPIESRTEAPEGATADSRFADYSTNDATTSADALPPYPVDVPATPDPEAQPGEAPVRWSDLAGSTRSDQLRNLLAAIGLVAIVFHGLKIYSALQGEPVSSRRRTRRR